MRADLGFGALWILLIEKRSGAIIKLLSNVGLGLRDRVRGGDYGAQAFLQCLEVTTWSLKRFAIDRGR